MPDVKQMAAEVAAQPTASIRLVSMALARRAGLLGFAGGFAVDILLDAPSRNASAVEIVRTPQGDGTAVLLRFRPWRG